MVLLRAPRTSRALVALLVLLLVPAGLLVVLAPAASAAPAKEPVTVSLVVADATITNEQILAVHVTLDPATATGTVRLVATNALGWRAEDMDGRPIKGGTLSTQFGIGEFGVWTLVAFYSGDATHQAASSVGVPVRITAARGQLVINEFRTSGPGGPADDYVEITNLSPNSVPLEGWTLVSGSGTRTVLPFYAFALEPGNTFLAAGKAFSLGATATPDYTGSLGTGGFEIVAPDGVGTVVDAVGPATGPHRGKPLPTISGATAAQWAFVRVERGGRAVDTGQNGNDFTLVSGDGGTVGGVPSMRGSASPSGMQDDQPLDAVVQSSLLDPGVGASALPNRRYVAGRPGLLEVRRRITNTSRRMMTSARVRVTSLSEANGLPYPGATQPTAPAALRVVDPQTPTSTVTLADRTTVTVQNLALDAAPTATTGGGLNSTFTVPLPSDRLLPGDSVTVAFTFDVDVPGTFWFGYDVEGTLYRSGGDRTTAPRPSSVIERQPAAQVGPRSGVASSLVRGTL